MAAPREEFREFKPRCMLVTGGLGLIGSHFMDVAVDAFPTCQFVVLDICDPTCGNIKNIEKALKTGRCQLVRGSIGSADLVAHILNEYAFDSVLHFAAFSHVDLSDFNSIAFTQNNVLGTHVLLECIRHYNSACFARGSQGIKKIIAVSTDECTAIENTDKPITEEATLHCTNVYSASKGCAELIAMSYFLSYGLPIVRSRGNNVFSIRQALNKAIPKFITQTINDVPITIHGDGKQRRSFMHALDTAEAFVTLMKFGQIGEVYNIGVDREWEMIDVARLILERMGKDPTKNIVFVRDRPFQDRRYYIDSSKLKALGWSTKRTLEDSIDSIIEWYRKHWSTWWDVDTRLMLEAHPKL